MSYQQNQHNEASYFQIDHQAGHMSIMSYQELLSVEADLDKEETTAVSARRVVKASAWRQREVDKGGQRHRSNSWGWNCVRQCHIIYLDMSNGNDKK